MAWAMSHRSSSRLDQVGRGFNPSTLILILIVVVAFYLLMIRPRQRRQQQAQQKQNTRAAGCPGPDDGPTCNATVVDKHWTATT